MTETDLESLIESFLAAAHRMQAALPELHAADAIVYLTDAY